MKWWTNECYLIYFCSDTVQYQTVYSGGQGEVLVLGLVPNSHIVIVSYNIEDGEIMEQVNKFNIFCGCTVCPLIWNVRVVFTNGGVHERYHNDVSV